MLMVGKCFRFKHSNVWHALPFGLFFSLSLFVFSFLLPHSVLFHCNSFVMPVMFTFLRKFCFVKVVQWCMVIMWTHHKMKTMIIFCCCQPPTRTTFRVFQSSGVTVSSLQNEFREVTKKPLVVSNLHRSTISFWCSNVKE